MILFKNGQLSEKDEKELRILLQECIDIFGDAYITKDRIRLYILENPDLLIRNLKLGDKIIFNENGMAAVIGYSDKSPRKYIKVLSKDLTTAYKLIKVMLWNVGDVDLYAKLKTVNPLINVLKKSGWRSIGFRGKEVLLMRKGTIFNKEK